MKKIAIKFTYLFLIITILMTTLASVFCFKKDTGDKLDFEDYVSKYNSLIERYNDSSLGGLKVGGEKEPTNSIDDYYISKRLIVKSFSRMLPSFGASEIIRGYNNFHIYQFDTIEKTISAYNNLSELVEVEYVDVDVEFSVATVNEGDKQYLTWGYDDIGVNDYTDYLNRKYSGSFDEVVVAVLDTGLDSDHSMFEGRVADGGDNFTDTDNTGKAKYEDGHGHGTHVSGTIVDLTPDNVKILPIKVMGDDGFGYLNEILNGIQHVLLQKESGLNVVAMNLSIGAYCPYNTTDFQSYAEKIDDAYEMDIMSVVAAGNGENGGPGNDVINYSPANIERAITVSAVGVDESGRYFRPTWSNYGTFVDVCAPGDNVNSATIDGGVGLSSGTSMATPHVSAVVALLSLDKDANYSLDSITSIITTTATDIGDKGRDVYFGYGLVNIKYGEASLLGDVIFSETETNCTSQFKLTLTATNLDGSINNSAKIFYTLDGSAPTVNSNLYVGEITISKTVEVKAIAYEMNSAGDIVAFSPVNSIVYNFYGVDVEGAFEVDEKGTLISYSGILTNITVPEKVNGITVTSIGDKVFRGTLVESILLPNSVHTLEKGAFENCFNLVQIKGHGVKTIETLAFNNCTSFKYLTNEYFPSLIEIGRGAFQKCTSLKSISLSKVEFVDTMAFLDASSDELTSVQMDSVEIICDYAFARCGSISSLVLPSVISINTGAFYMNNLTTINLTNVKYVGNMAFYENNITSIEMPKCEVIGESAFYYMQNLNTLKIPSVKKIYNSAFYNCLGLSVLQLDGCEYIGNDAFSNAINLTSLSLPSAKFIGDGAFENIYILTNLSLPKVEEIGNYAFSNGECLEECNLSSVITCLSESAFKGCLASCVFSVYKDTVAEDVCNKLDYIYVVVDNYNDIKYEVVDNKSVRVTGYISTATEIVIPISIEGMPVVEIGSNAFAGCINLYTVNLPYLNIIGDNAFNGCINLKDVVVKETIQIGSHAFDGCVSLTDVEIPKVETILAYAFYNCESLKDIKLPNTISAIAEKAIGYINNGEGDVVVEGYLIKGYANTIAEKYAEDSLIEFIARFNDLTRYYYNYNEDKSAIYIAEVEDFMVGNTILPSEYQPLGYDSPLPIIAIEDEAFKDCAFITGVQLPSSIVSIGNNAFAGCVSLEYINLEYVTAIGKGVFYNCESLKEIQLPKITNVSSKAFANCYNLKVVTLDIAATIGDNAFYNCFRLERVIGDNLTEIKYRGFYNAYKLKDINTTKLVTIGSVGTFSVSGEVFYNCYSLEKMKLKNIKIIGSRVFDNSGIEEIIIGKELTYISNNAISSDISIVGFNNSKVKEYANLYNKKFIEISEFELLSDLKNSINITINKLCSLTVSVGGYDQIFQWFECFGDYDGSEILQGNNSIQIDTSVAGVRYYYVKVTNWDDSVLYSNICAVNIIDGFIINASASVGGEISNSGEIIINNGESITYYITVNTGYKVKSIIVDGFYLNKSQKENAVKNGYTFSSVSADHSISVAFEKIQFVIMIECIGGGSVNHDGENIIHYGGQLSVDFYPDAGYRVKSIMIDGEEKGEIVSYLFTNIIADHTVIVEFEIKKYNVNIVYGSGGSVASNIDSVVNYGDSVNITITPDENYGIASIEVNDEKLEISNTIEIANVSSDLNIKITFAKQFKIECVSGEGGDVVDTKVVIEGEQTKIDFTPQLGYKVKEVIIDNQSFGAINSYVFSNVNENHIVSVQFEKIKFTINVVCFGEGNIVCADGLEGIEYSSDRVIKITPKNGWIIDAVTVDGKNVILVNNELVLENIDSNKTLRVVFVEGETIEQFNLDKVKVIGVITLIVISLIVLMAVAKKVKSKRE